MTAQNDNISHGPWIRRAKKHLHVMMYIQNLGYRVE
jgi:hypothetical protein